jgi:hypothetical protein
MGVADINALQAILKQKYTQRRFDLLCYKDNPLFALMRKDTSFGGKNKVIGLRYGVTAGQGTVFGTALANVTASAYGGFVVTRAYDYAVGGISGEMVYAAKGNENALVEGLTKEIDGAIHACTRSIAINMFRNGGGQRGQVSSGSTVGSTTISLANITDVTNFEVGMVLQSSSDDGSPVAPAGVRTGTVTITKVDRNLGNLTGAANWNAGIPAIATGDYLFRQSDYANTIKGLSAWVPASAPPSNDSFFTVNRSVDATRLAGINYNGQGGPIEESCIEVAARGAREGASFDYLFMNPLDWSKLVKALGAKVIYERIQEARGAGGTTVPVGFKAVLIDGAKGPIRAVADVNCPLGQGFMVQLDTWALESAGPAPMILEQDGLKIRADPTNDVFYTRVGAYHQVTCEAPGWNANITW